MCVHECEWVSACVCVCGWGPLSAPASMLFWMSKSETLNFPTDPRAKTLK